MKNLFYYITFVLFSSLVLSCSHSKKFTKSYYQENENGFQSLYWLYKNIYAKNPFALQIIDKSSKHISLEITTDSIRYIDVFDIGEKKLDDTLQKYHFDIKAMKELMNDMQKLRCTWITSLDYYENREKKYLVFISVRHKDLETFLKKTKYFTLAFFEQSQPSDIKGRLKDKSDDKHLRKINGAVFRRINDKVFYAFTLHFR